LKRFIILALSLVLVLFLIPSCITVQAPASLITPPAGQPSVISTFSSYPYTINPGGTSNLSWNVTGANSISIDNGIGLVNASGTMVVSPATSTVYTVSATNSAGTVTRSAVTMVNSVSSQPVGTPPVIIEFSSNPSIINSAGTSNLSWNVTGADSASIDNGIGQVNASGTMAVSPATSTTYTIIAANYNSTVTSSTTIIVNAGGISGTSSAGTDTIWH
jgi:hypothetical protein